MLAGDFFNLTSLDLEEGKIRAALEINPAHLIFDGHFPGQPVVPGVCMMQMVREILDAALARCTRLESADNLKFLHVMNPVENNTIQAAVDYLVMGDGKLKVQALLNRGPVIYFRMNAVFIFEDSP
jgi:3-hydroxyacyl-[acyl-carrier-protein] dehydratase